MLTLDEQTALWVSGNSQHTTENRSEGFCTPDFSCCNPNSGWPIERREFFRDHPDAQNEMLFMSLGAEIAELAPDVMVRIVGDG